MKQILVILGIVACWTSAQSGGPETISYKLHSGISPTKLANGSGPEENNRLSISGESGLSRSHNGFQAFEEFLSGAVSCADPIGFTASNVTAGGVSLTFDNTGDDYEVEYGLCGFTQGSGMTASGTEPISLSGLNPASCYDVYVRRDCGTGGFSNWAGPFQFSTLCNPPSAVTLPFTEDFEVATGTFIGSEPAAYCRSEVSWSFETNRPLNGRLRFDYYPHNGTKAATLDVDSADNGKAVNYLVGTINMSNYDTSSTNFFLLSFFHRSHGDFEDPRDSVWVRGSNTDPWIGIYDLYANQVNGAFVQAQNIELKDILKNANQNFSSTFQLRFGQEGYRATTSIGGGHGRTFDDILIEEVNCPDPTGFAVNTLTSSSVTLAFDNTGNDFEVEVGPCGFTQGMGALSSGTEPLMVTGLMSNTCYDVYVRRDCGSGSFSNWVGPFQFHTLCGAPSPVTLPFTEDFEGATGAFIGSELNLYCRSEVSWSFETDQPAFGRIRFTSFSGSQGATLDRTKGGNPFPVNYLIGTINMSNYDTSSANFIVLSFLHNSHSDGSHPADSVWIRGNDTDPWIGIYDLAANQVSGTFVHAQNIELNSILKSANQNFSNTFQLRFGQEDYSFAGGMVGNSGRTFDDILIEEVSCLYPTDFAAITTSNITATSASLTFDNTGDDYEVEYGPCGFVQGGGMAASGTEPISLSGLNATSCYEVYVRRDCGSGNFSDWVGPFQFSTPCTGPSAVTLPFTEDFEGATGTFIGSDPAAYCRSEVNWSFETNKSLYGRLRFDPYSNNGSKGATLDANDEFSPYTRNYLIGTINMSNYDTSSVNFFLLSFFHRSHYDDPNPGDSVWVRGSDTDPWIGIYDLYANQVNGTFVQAQNIGLKEILKSADQNFSSTFQLRFGQEGTRPTVAPGGSHGRTFDDILIEEVGCLEPTGFTVDTLTSNSATLSFDTMGYDYEVEVGPCGFTQGMGTLSSGTDPLMVTGLMSNTCYDVYVRRDCGSGSLSGWVGPFQFHTLCGIPSAVTLPLAEDFEGASGTFIGSELNLYCRSEVSWSFETNEPAHGRVRFDQYSNNGTKGATLDRNAAGNPQPANYLIGTINMSNYDTSSANFIVLSFFHNSHNDEADPGDSLWIRGSDTDPWVGAYDLFANQVSGTFVHAQNIELNNILKSAHQNFSSTFQLRFGQEGQYPAVVMGGNDGRTFDDILIEEISCLKPTGFTASNVTATGAILTFDNTGDDYEVEYGLCGFTPGHSMAASGPEPISLSGLNPASCYDVYVRRDCGAGDFSDWAGPFQFHTPCTAPVPATLPFIEDFEGASGTIVGDMPAVYCRSDVSWSFETNRPADGRLSFGPFPYIGSKAATLDSKSEGSDIEWVENYLTGTINMSNYDTSSTNYFFLSFYQRGHDNEKKDSIWIRGSNTDPWVGIYELGTNNGPIYAQYIDLKPILKNANQNFSSTFQIRFEQKGYLPHSTLGLTHGRTFDDIAIEEVNCMDTIGYSAGNITADGVTITFNNTVDNFEVEAGTCGFTPGTGTTFAGTGTISVTGLTENTCYDVYVRRDCGTQGFSDWVGPYTFTTLCNVVTAPYREDFENFTTRFFDGAQNCVFISSDKPGISKGYSWEVRNTASATSGTGPDRDNTLAPNTGGKFVAADVNGSVAGDESRLLTPVVDISGLSNPELGYFYHMYGTQMADLHVDIWDGTQWLLDQQLITGAQNTGRSDPYNETTLDLSTYSADTVQVRFRVSSNGCCAGDVAIDDIRISEPITCPYPSNLSATNLSASSADLHWTGGGATNWNVEYGPAGFNLGSGTYLSTTNPTSKITGLSPFTEYEFYVRDSCGAGNVSFWTGPFQFRTRCTVPPPVTLPFAEDFEGASGTYIGGTPGVYCSSEVSWSFETDEPAYGRIRFDSYSNSGSKGATLDRSSLGLGSPQPGNYLTGTINMSNYDTSSANSIMLSFFHNSHDNNSGPFEKVWVRGSHTNGWIQVYDLYANQVNGTFIHAEQIDIKEKLKNANQNFSSTFQLRFGQHGNDAATSLSGSSGRTFDDILIEEISCWKPTGFAASNITSSAATLTFDNTSDNYEVEVGPCGFTQGAGSLSSGAEPLNITGLIADTCYEVYVRRDCGGGDFSYWEGPFQFSTQCPAPSAVTLPFTEGFEGASGTYIGSKPNAYCRPEVSWSFETDQPDHGRLRFNSFSRNGTNGATLDRNTTGTLRPQNYLIGTIDMSNYDTSAATFYVLSFYYNSHGGGTHSGDGVWIRGSNTDTWIKAHSLSANQVIGTFIEVKDIDLKNILKSANQNFSSTFQLRFGQSDASAATALNAVTGFTFDDVLIEEVSCLDAASLSVVSTSTTGATFAFDNTGDNYQVEVGPCGFTQGTGMLFSGSDPLTVSGLNNATCYEVYARRDCGAGGFSPNWIGPFQFRTRCPAPSPVTLPFTEDFEGASGTFINSTYAVHCRPEVSWSFETDMNGSGRLRFDSFSHNGTQGATLDHIGATYGGQSENYLIGVINMSNYDTSSANPIVLDFFHNSHGDDPSTLDKVYIRGSHTNSWIQVYDLYANQVNGTFVHAQEIDLTQRLKAANQNFSSTFQLRFGQYGNDAAISLIKEEGRTIDDILIREINCLKPVAFTASNIRSTAVTLTFDNTGDNYEIEIGPCGFTQGMGTLSSGVEPLNITGLMADTCYEVYVRRDCGGGDFSYWEGPFQFSTQCPAPSAVTLPLTEDFEGASGTFIGSKPAAYCRSEISWSFETNQPDHGRLRFDSYSNTGTKGATLDGAYSGHPVNYLVGTINMSNYDTSATNFYPLSFYYNSHSDGGDPADSVWIRGSVDDPWIGVYDLFANKINGTFVHVQNIELKSILKAANQNFSNTFQVRFGQEGVYAATSLTGVDGYTFDDIMVEEVNCLRPADFSTSNLTLTSATLTFDNTGENYEVEVGPCGFTQGTGNLSSGSEPLTVTGLSAGSCYEVYVRRDCGTPGFSSWAGPFQFSTPGTTPGPVTLPFTEGFEAASGTYIGNTPNAYGRSEVIWNFETDQPSDGRLTFDDFAHNGSKGATLDRLNNGQPVNYLIGTINMSNYDTSAISYFQLSFFHNSHGDNPHPGDSVWIRGSNTDPWIGVYDLYANQVGGTFVQTREIDLKHTLKNANQNFSSTFQLRFGQEDNGSATSLNGAGGRTFDDILIKKSCPDPSGFSATRTSSGTTIIFDDVGDEYELQLGPCGFTLGDGVIYYVKEPVNSSAHYNNCTEAYVRRDCSSGGFSNWVGPFSLDSLCSGITAPYREDFENFTVGFFDGAQNCVAINSDDPGSTYHGYSWEVRDVAQTTTGAATGPDRDNTLAPAIGGKFVTADVNGSGAGDETNLITPMVDISGLSNPELGYYYHMYGSQMADLHVDIWDGSQWLLDQHLITGAQNTSPSDPYNDTILDLSHYNVTIIRVRFRVSSNGCCNGDVAIDDIRISDPVTCPDPSNLGAANVTSSSADMFWTGGGAMDWNVEYGPDGFNTGSGTYLSSTNDTLAVTGLSPGTQYDFYVRDSCGAGDVSFWAGPFSFTTLVCPDPSGLGITNLSASGADLYWTGGGATDWNVEYGTAGFTLGSGTYTSSTNDTLAVNSLSPGTQYDFYVRDSCGMGDVSAWVGPFSFSTLTCPDPSNLGVTNVSASNADLYWTGGGATDWNVEYGTAGFTLGFGTYVSSTNDTLAVNSLSPGTQYEFYVRDSCDMGDVSFWVGPFSFNTLSAPGPVTLPFTAGFQGANGTYIGNTPGVYSNSAVMWSFETSQPAYGRVTFGAFGNNGTTGVTLDAVSDGMPEGASNDPVNYLIGTIDMSNYDTSAASFYVLSFYHNSHGDDPHPTDSVWIRGSNTDPWIGVYDLFANQVNGTFVHAQNIDLKNILKAANQNFSSTFQLRFGQEDNSSATSMSGVDGRTFDDITIEQVSCLDPTGFTASNVTATGASLTFDNTGNNYEVEVGPCGFTQGMGMLSSGIEPLNITGLLPDTCYDVYVRKGCGGGDFSNWVGPFSFNTLVCPDPSSLGVTNVSSSGADLYWTGGGAADWNVEYGPAGFNIGSGTYLSSTNDTLVVTDLSPGTQYDFYVRDSCGVGNVSLWTGPFSFSTLVCAVPTGLDTANVSCTTADLIWTSPAGHQSLVEYGPAGFTPGTGIKANYVASPYTLSSLSPNVSYDFYVADTCGNDTSAWVMSSFTTASGPIAAGFTFNPGNPTPTDLTITFDASSSVGATDYSWDFGDGNSGTGMNTTHTYTANGTYYVTLTVTGPCDTATFSDSVTVAGINLEENIISSSLSIYPNPTSGMLDVSFDTQGSGDAILSITDLSGRLVEQIDATDLNGHFKDQLDLSKLARGTYLLRVESGGMTAVVRIVKE